MIAAEEPSTILRLKSRRKCFDDKRLQWFDHLEKKMEESAWSSKRRTF